MPNATPTLQTGGLSLVDKQIFALFVFLPLQFGDLAISGLVDSGAIHNFLATSLLLKLLDSLSFVSIDPCQVQVTLADGGVVQAAQLATLAPKVVDDQGVIVPGMLAVELYALDILPAKAFLYMPF